MAISHSDYLAMETRLAQGRRDRVKIEHNEGCEDESELHREILDYCNHQWPRWKVIHARMDQRSTIPVGAQDLTIFKPDGKVLCIECKRKGAKPTIEQQAWHKEMEMLGHKVHVVYSYREFLEIVK